VQAADVQMHRRQMCGTAVVVPELVAGEGEPDEQGGSDDPQEQRRPRRGEESHLHCNLLPTPDTIEHRKDLLIDPPAAWTYLLRCGDGSLYCGWTVDLQVRLQAHRAGRASRYTASRRPVELALALPMPDRTSARRAEALIKRMPRARKLELVHNFGA
jgi:putative endonuclease